MQAKLTPWLAMPLILAMSSVLADTPDGQTHESHTAVAERAAEASGAEHRDCHSHDSSSAKHHAAAQADEQQVTADRDRRKTRPSDIRRKRGPRR